MNNQPLKLVMLLMTLFLVGCATSTETKKPEQAVTFLNEYPTQDRVEFVLQCIEQNGGLRYETLYPCICSIDKIAAKMSYKDYAEAMTFTFLRRTPGEKGGIFRDPPKAQALRKQLKDAKAFAEKSCFVR